MSDDAFARYRAGLAEEPPEGAIPVRVSGAIPDDLRGDWLSNGPAVFSAGAVRYRHWLDGDGWVLRIRFADRVTARAALVGTEKRRVEREAGRAVFRTFGTAFEGDALVLGQGIQSPANISIESWNGRLLAFGEQGLPYELDPETLATRGRFTFGRRLNVASPLAAHPKIDPVTGGHVAFGVSFNPRHPTITLYESNAGLDTTRHRIPLPYPASIHDFALTRRYAVFYVSPYVLDLGALREDGRSVLEALAWKPELGARLLVVARDDGTVLYEDAVDGGYCLHLANAFESGDGVVVDLLELDRPVYPHYQLVALYAGAPRGRPVRWRLDPRRNVARREAHDDAEASVDFPVVPPDAVGRAQDVVWYLAMSGDEEKPRLFDRLCRLEWSTGALRTLPAPPGAFFAGEPALTEDGRHLLVPVCGPEGSALWVLGPELADSEPRARVASDRAWPHRFHGAWAAIE